MEREVTDGHGGHNALVLLLFSRGDVAARESSADQPYYAGPATIATTLYCLGRGRYGFLDLLSLSLSLIFRGCLPLPFSWAPMRRRRNKDTKT